jgi:hypothetical protein
MGQHTAFIMKCALKPTTPDEVIKILKFMTDEPEVDEYEGEVPNHPLFETDCWEYILLMGGGDLWDPHSTLLYDTATNTYTLSIRTSVKDQEDQVCSFLHWIAPYSSTEGFLGYIHPEYSHLQSRILFEDGRAFIVEPVENAAQLVDFTEPKEDKRMEELLNIFNSIAKENPEAALMLIDQLKPIEVMAKNKASVAKMPDNSQYLFLKEKLETLPDNLEELDDR